MKKFNETVKKYYLIVLLTIALFLLSLIYLNVYWLPRVPDPFGYILNAAYFAGVDWSEISRHMTNYYGYGYSLALIPLFLLSKNFLIFTKATMVLNALILCISYLLLDRTAKHLFPEMPDKTRNICGFAVMSFSSYLYEINTILPEIFTVFIALLSINCLINIEKKRKPTLYIVLFAVIISFSPAFHGRCLVLWAIGSAIILALLIFKKIRVYQFIIFGATNLPILLLYRILEHILKINMYSQNKLSNSSSSVASTLIDAINYTSVKNIFIRYFCQLSYISLATLFLYIIGLTYLLVRLIEKVKKSKTNPSYCLFTELYIFLTAIGVGFLSAYVFREPRRIDQAIYGRHNEMLMSIIVMYGLICIYSVNEQSRKNNKRIIMGAVLLNFAVCGITVKNLSEMDLKSLVIIPRSILGINVIYDYIVKNPYIFLYFAYIVVILFLIIILFSSKNKALFYPLICVLFVFNILTSVKAIHQEMDANMTQRAKYWDMYEYMEKNPNSEIIALYFEEDDFIRKGDYLIQLFGYKKPIRYVSVEDLKNVIDEADDNVIIYSEKWTDNMDKFEDYEFEENLYLKNNFFVWKRQENL